MTHSYEGMKKEGGAFFSQEGRKGCRVGLRTEGDTSAPHLHCALGAHLSLLLALAPCAFSTCLLPLPPDLDLHLLFHTHAYEWF